jgi:hypothetical protein
MTRKSVADDIRNDLLAVRVINLLLQSGKRRTECARFLRELASWYEPPGTRACEVCDGTFRPTRRTHAHCSAACRAVAYRHRKSLRVVA